MPKKKGKGGRKKSKNRSAKPQDVVRETRDVDSNNVSASAAKPPAVDKGSTNVTAKFPAAPEAEADVPFFDLKPSVSENQPAVSIVSNAAPQVVGEDKRGTEDVISDAKRKVQEQAEKLAQRRQRRTQNGSRSGSSSRPESDEKDNAAEDSGDEDPLNYSYASTIQRDAAARASTERQRRQKEEPPLPPSSSETAAVERNNTAAPTSVAAMPKSGAKHEPEMKTEANTESCKMEPCDVPTPTLKPPKQASAAARRAREKHELIQAQSITQSRSEEFQRAADTANGLQSSQMVQQLQRKILAASYTAHGPDLEALFARLLKQNSHQGCVTKSNTHTGTDVESLTLEAFGQVVQKMLPGMLLPPQLRQLVAIVDADGDGAVSMADFVGFAEAREDTQAHTPRRLSSSGDACTTPRSSCGEQRRHSMPEDLTSPKSITHSPAERFAIAPGDDEDGSIVRKWQQNLGKNSGTVARSPTMDLDDMIVKLQHKLLAKSYTPHGPDPGALFQRLDTDGSGVLSLEQFGHAVQRMLPGLLGVRDMKRLRSFITTNKHGHVGQAEFIAFVLSAPPHSTDRSGDSSSAAADIKDADSMQDETNTNSLHERLYSEAIEWKKAHDHAFAREEAVSGNERLRRDGLKSIMRNPAAIRGSPQHKREIGWGRGGTVSGGKIDRLESWRVQRERDAAEKRLKPRSRATVESISSRLHEKLCIDDRKRKELEQQASRNVTFKPTISKASRKMVTRTSDAADAEALLAGGTEAQEAKERREKALTDRLYSEAEKRRVRRERETLKKKQMEEAKLTFQPQIIGVKSSGAKGKSRRCNRAKEARACKRLYKQGVALKQRKKQEEQAQTPPAECTFKPKMHTSKRATSTVQHVASGTAACDRLYANAQKLSQKRKQLEDRAHRERLELLKGGSPSSF